MDTEWIISVSFVLLQSCILHRSWNSRSYKISHFLLHSLSERQHLLWSWLPRPLRLIGMNSNQFSCSQGLETRTCNEKSNDIVIETFRLTEPYYTDRYRFLLFRLSSWSGLFELIEVWNHKHGIPRSFSVYEPYHSYIFQTKTIPFRPFLTTDQAFIISDCPSSLYEFSRNQGILSGLCVCVQ